jgi:hypothetical protein
MMALRSALVTSSSLMDMPPMTRPLSEDSS